MNIDNVFDLLIAVVFAMHPQPQGIGTKSQDLTITFCLGEGELSYNSTLDLFSHKVNFSVEWWNSTNKQPHR